MEKTTAKQGRYVITGAEGNTFATDNQPLPELKKAGWAKWREERHLTQSIIKEMIGDNGKPKKNLKEYVQSLIENAKLGNSKAIETINRGIEDDILKIEHSGSIETKITITLDGRFNHDKDDPRISP